LAWLAKAETLQLEAQRVAEAASLDSELALFDEPFPWLGSWSEKLYWALCKFGLSEVGVKHKAGQAARGGRDIWINEDGTVDFVNADDVTRT